MRIKFNVNTARWEKGKEVELDGGIASYYVHLGWASYCLGGEEKTEDDKKINYSPRKKSKRGN